VPVFTGDCAMWIVSLVSVKCKGLLD